MNFALVIPAYNASDTLGRLLERALRIVPPEKIVVVDDGSRDGTGAVAGKYSVAVVLHPVNKGKGAALQSGFDWCCGRSFDAAVTMDADLQHSPEDIPRFIEFMSLNDVDIVLGSRLHNTNGMPFLRLLSNTITTFLVSIRTGVQISDSQSGFRCVRRSVLEMVRLESAGFEAETEFLIKAASKSCSFGSVPIDTVYAGEKSHMTHVATTLNFIKVLLRQY